MGKYRHSMYSRTGHMTMETVYGQTLALRLGNGDEYCPLELDITGLNVKGNLYLNGEGIMGYPKQEHKWVCESLENIIGVPLFTVFSLHTGL